MRSFTSRCLAADLNERLSRSVRDARNEMFIPYDMTSFDEPRGGVLADHRAVNEAVREEDSIEAAQLMAEHVRQTANSSIPS